MAKDNEKRTGAEKIEWNLGDLYNSEEKLISDLQDLLVQAEAFGSKYRGRIDSLGIEELQDALELLEVIYDTSGRAYTFAYLNWSTQTSDAASGALLQRVKETYTRIHQHLLFFDVEWSAIPESRALVMLADSRLDRYGHYLELQQRHKEYILSEPEEKILSEKNITGRSAWNRFFDETLGAARFTFRDEELSEQVVLTKLSDPDRSVRKDAAMSLTEGLRSHLRTLTFIFNTILADKASNDRLRGYPSWISSRNLANEASDETVNALVDAVTSRYDLSVRYYALKRRLLGLDKMMDYDRYAPIGEVDTFYTWDEAEKLVREAYKSFHPEMERVAGRFFDENWIHASLKDGKRGGAFSHGAVPSAHPYVFMNYTGRARDVQTLAHELGHGVHQYLSRTQGVFHSDTPLTTAETASVFGEMLVFQRLMSEEEDPRARLTLLMSKIDDTMATVFRQISMNRFEDRIHGARREEGELSADRFSDLWMETQSGMFGESVELGDHYRIWWCYIPHFLHTPGYVYAYAFGELLVLALYARYQADPAGFPDLYLQLLSAGGSDWPERLLAPLGVDLTDPAFWNTGLASVETWISEAEHLSDTL